MKIQILLAVCFSAIAGAAPVYISEYNPQELVVEVSSEANPKAKVEMLGEWFEEPLSNIGEKFMEGVTPLATYNNSVYYLKNGKSEELSDLFLSKNNISGAFGENGLSEHMKSFLDFLLSSKIKAYALSGDLCLIFFTNATYSVLKFHDGKWYIDSKTLYLEKVMEYYPILEFLKKENLSSPNINKGALRLDAKLKELIEKFRESEKSEEENFYVLYAKLERGEIVSSEVVKVGSSDPRVVSKMEKVNDKESLLDINCKFQEASLSTQVSLPIEDNLVLLRNSSKNKGGVKKDLFIVLFSSVSAKK